MMPCYNKKLKASRSDFYNEQYATRDVDCVLITGELLLLAQEHGIELSLLVPDEDISPSPSPPPPSSFAIPILRTPQPPGSTVGSYLHSLILTVARTYRHPLALESKVICSVVYAEHTLRDASSGSSVFRGTTCYVLRNLQNVIRRLDALPGQVGGGTAGRDAWPMACATTGLGQEPQVVVVQHTAMSRRWRVQGAALAVAGSRARQRGKWSAARRRGRLCA